MEVDIKGGLRVNLNFKTKTSSVIQSPEATGTVLIPRFVEYENEKYKIISISRYSFNGNNIDYLTFPEDSEIETFDSSSLSGAHIKKLKIPASLTHLVNRWCCNLNDLDEIEVSPKNNHFICVNNEFLLGKSNGNSSKFDVLHYARSDIEDALIPPQVEVIKTCSFDRHKKLKSITFSEDSKLKVIEDHAFFESSIQKLVLPASLEQFGDSCFSSVKHLTDVTVSPKNELFSLFDNKFIVKKSLRESKIFDVIVFARRDIEEVTIPSHIKVISTNAFQYCVQLKTINFEPNSSLEVIKNDAFSDILGQEKISLPPSLKEIDDYSFSFIKNARTIEFLSQSIRISSYCFYFTSNLSTILFPNAEKITLNNNSISIKKTKVFVRKETKLFGDGIEKCKNQIFYIDDREESDKETTKKVDHSITKPNDEDIRDVNQSLVKANESLKRYVTYLQTNLHNFTDFLSFDQFIEEGATNKTMKDKHALIGPDDEEYQKVVCKIGEGATSDVFKVVDIRTGHVMCKKVIKESHDEESFRTLRNSLKEIEVVLSIRHPCVCKGLGYNMQEKVNDNSKQKEEEEDENENENSKKQEKTTIALFFEYLPFTVKSVIDNKMMTNTLKTRIAVEVAFGMSHIHNLGMMHRDLKLENIMLSSVFGAKIIDFGLVHFTETSESQNSLTKGVGTLAYMSPEMLNEEEYDEKTDIYSYGILLFCLFNGRLPKQSLKEKMEKVPLKLPEASAKMSEYCIEVVKKCTLFSPAERPSFDELIEDMRKHSFALASEIDSDVILARYRELHQFKLDQSSK